MNQMAEKVDATISHAQAYEACEKAGKPGTSKHTTCKKMIDVCLSQPSDSYTLITDAGPVKLDNQSQCVSASIDLADMNFKLLGSKVKPKKDAPQKSAEKSKPDKPNRPNPKRKNEAAPRKPAAPIASPDVCKKFSTTGKNKNKACTDFMSICTAKPKGPYALPTSVGQLTADDQKSCTEIAMTLADMGYDLAKPKSSNNSESSVEPSESEEESPASETGPRFTKSFADIRLGLRVTGERYVDVKRTLLFDGGKGIPIWLKYSVKRKQDDTFFMRYTVFKNGRALDDEQSLTFKADAGKINLAFEVILKSEGNFGNVESIRIIDLSDQ